ncbi:hypothetical protein B0H10DRAFT_1952607 [Mycena sp. CBHHK59/15]|nr:hypothetical protein B0H10DRAFT_1952607 [Mycena sp. CBHHK59/15]
MDWLLSDISALTPLFWRSLFPIDASTTHAITFPLTSRRHTTIYSRHCGAQGCTESFILFFALLRGTLRVSAPYNPPNSIFCLVQAAHIRGIKLLCSLGERDATFCPASLDASTHHGMNACTHACTPVALFISFLVPPRASSLIGLTFLTLKSRGVNEDDRRRERSPEESEAANMYEIPVAHHEQTSQHILSTVSTHPESPETNLARTECISDHEYGSRIVLVGMAGGVAIGRPRESQGKSSGKVEWHPQNISMSISPRAYLSGDDKAQLELNPTADS